MKKLLLWSAFILATITFCKEGNAQLKIGGGLSVGTELSIDDDGSEKAAFGLCIKGDYEISEKFSVSPGLNFFFPSAPSGVDVSAYEIFADAHYSVLDHDQFKVYGIGGLNYSYYKVDLPLLGEVSDSEIGLDLGTGIQSKGNTQFFGELKYNTAFENVIVSVGLLFSI